MHCLTMKGFGYMERPCCTMDDAWGLLLSGCFGFASDLLVLPCRQLVQIMEFACSALGTLIG